MIAEDDAGLKALHRIQAFWYGDIITQYLAQNARPTDRAEEQRG